MSVSSIISSTISKPKWTLVTELSGLSGIFVTREMPIEGKNWNVLSCFQDVIHSLW